METHVCVFRFYSYTSFHLKLTSPLPSITYYSASNLFALLGLHSTSLQPSGELLPRPAQLSAGARKKCWRRAGRERVKKCSPAAQLLHRVQPTPARQDPAPNITQSWPRDTGLRGTGVQAADGGMMERRSPAPGRASATAAAVTATPNHWRALALPGGS